MTAHAAIPTAYAGVRFRSRVEARWAAFFDALGWAWEYEPIDLRGYIPDFILPFAHGPLLIEVKSELDLMVLGEHAPKIREAGWDGEFLLVGARLWEGCADDGGGFDTDVSPGLLGWAGGARSYEDTPNGGCLGWWEEERAVLFDCWDCKRSSVRQQSEGSYRCRLCGSQRGWRGPRAVGFAPRVTPFLRIWAEAGNAVRWRAGA